MSNSKKWDIFWVIMYLIVLLASVMGVSLGVAYYKNSESSSDKKIAIAVIVISGIVLSLCLILTPVPMLI